MKTKQSATKQVKKKISPVPKVFLIIEREIELLILPLILFFILIAINQITQTFQKQLATTKLKPLTYQVSIQPYPIVEKLFTPNISAKAALISDDTSKTVLFEKNAKLHFSMASTTKVMTALVALDHYQPRDVLTVYRPGIEGARVGFHLGERVYFEDILYGMLLPSGNDAAYAIADNYPGGVVAFVAKMNEKAAALKLYDTHYADPAGLNDDENYTTARDLSRLTSVALKYSVLAKVVATKDKTIHNVEYTNTYALRNLNRLLGTEGITGVKTGYTQGAGEVLITSKKEHGHTFIIVVMQSKERFIDTEELLTLIANNITYVTPQFGGVQIP